MPGSMDPFWTGAWAWTSVLGEVRPGQVAPRSVLRDRVAALGRAKRANADPQGLRAGAHHRVSSGSFPLRPVDARLPGAMCGLARCARRLGRPAGTGYSAPVVMGAQEGRVSFFARRVDGSFQEHSEQDGASLEAPPQQSPASRTSRADWSTCPASARAEQPRHRGGSGSKVFLVERVRNLVEQAGALHLARIHLRGRGSERPAARTATAPLREGSDVRAPSPTRLPRDLSGRATPWPRSGQWLVPAGVFHVEPPHDTTRGTRLRGQRRSEE